MRTIFEGSPRVHYGFMALSSNAGADFTNGQRARRGQNNGLCGARVPGELHFTTALHTGEVGFRIESWDAEPPVDDRWDEVVDVSFVPGPEDAALAAFEWWQQLDEWDLTAGANYRARYCCEGVAEANAVDTLSIGQPVIDRYLLQLWPSDEATSDVVVRATTEWAGYWHGVARRNA